jgi:oxygen-independent coproporphyrinogen-3 oxidase
MPGIYVHIPFCDTKCIYCDFYSITNHTRKNELIDSLITEITRNAPRVKEKTFDSVFFGGGTPSLLSFYEFNKIFESLYANYNISPDCEITIEANPGTMDIEKLSSFRKLPINRLSFGVQSFIDTDLKFLTRIHSAAQAETAIKSAQDAGFDNINLDLIFALPEQTLDNWKYNLEKAVNLDTKHISAYSLIFEDGTFLNTLLHKNKVKKADTELEQQMYEYTMQFLSENGFTQYEISNYSKPGYECKHNLKYWTHEDYIAFGPSAASFIDGYRYVNVRDLGKYIEAINSGKDAYDFTEFIDRDTSITEYIFLGLRSTGIDLEKFKTTYNLDFTEKYNSPINILVQNGFASLTSNNLKLTRKGYSVCDEIVTTYF